MMPFFEFKNVIATQTAKEEAHEKTDVPGHFLVGRRLLPLF
jgi:hypothetical protein